MTCPVSVSSPDRLRFCTNAKLWRLAGTMGPVILSRFRDLTFLFAGTLPEIAVALVNSVILPLLTKKTARGSNQPQ